jgi:hypothetical protein
MQAVAVDHLGNLLGAHPSVLPREAVEYGFFNLHLFNILISPTKIRISERINIRSGIKFILMQQGCLFKASESI